MHHIFLRNTRKRFSQPFLSIELEFQSTEAEKRQTGDPLDFQRSQASDTRRRKRERTARARYDLAREATDVSGDEKVVGKRKNRRS